MDLDFVPTIGDEEELSVVESSDDDRSEPVVAKKALGRKAKARERRKQRKLAKKQKKASRAEPEAPPAFGTVTAEPFFAAGDFEDADGREQAPQVVPTKSGAWDFEEGIMTKKTVSFDGITTVRDKVLAKRHKRSKSQSAPPPEPAAEQSNGDNSEEDSDAEQGSESENDEGGSSPQAAPIDASDASDASESDEEEEQEDGEEETSSSEDDSGEPTASNAESDEVSASDSEEDDGADDDGSDASTSDDEEASTSDDEENSDGSESGSEEESSDDESVASLDDDRTRQLKEAKVAPAEDAEGKKYFESDPFLAGMEEAHTFAALHLSRPLLRAISELGYKAPTAIQRRVIPLCLAGRDVCGSAVTGSGKTAAFLLPALERLLFRPKHIPATRVLIVTPTRELATQILSMTKKLCKYTDIRAALAVGGHSLKVQEADLRARPEIVVCTPGRLIDLLRNAPNVHMDDIDILILDEADRLLEMGFRDEVEEIVKHCPINRQTVLLSATMVAQVKELINLSLKKPVRVSADPLYDVAQRLSQEFVRIRSNREGDREAILVSLITRSFKEQVIVFCPTKKLAHRLTIVLGLAGVDCGELHGDLTQQQRLDALNAFKEKQINVLVATDLASRGLDIAGVKTVINFTMPRDLTRYVHRVGRTARAGRAGVAVTLTGEQNRSAMRQIVKRASTNVKSRQVPPEVITYWRNKIESFEEDISDIMKQEAVEKELRVAQMEAMRAANLMSHHKDIMSRPARTWFQSVAEKAAVKQAVLDQLRKGSDATTAAPIPQKSRKQIKAELKAAAAAQPTKRPHRMTRHKRRRMQAEAEDAMIMKQMARAGKDSADKELQAKAAAAQREQVALKTQRSKAKAAKARVRKAQDALNSSTGTAMKILRQGTAIVGAAKTVTVKTKKRARGSAFEFDEVDVRKGRVQRQRVVEKPSAGSQVKASGRRYADVTRTKDRSAGQSFKFVEHTETRKLRKGGRPARNAFKSKQRYNKRRKR